MAPHNPSSGHKPRKRRAQDEAVSGGSTRNTVLVDASAGTRRPAFPLVAFLWPARGHVSPWFTIPIILMVAFLFRLATGFWGYSGSNSPPMHGDFEAQRHWMEITIHLPISQWYSYDLQWWGLDYPPLTAYHSWLLGKIGSIFDPEWFALDASRALDDPNLKVYMRGTALVSEYLTYIPAAVVLVRRYSRIQGVNSWEAYIALVAILMQPATILIDHGHFQYNTVMLGFLLASISSMMAGRLLWSCVFFVASLGFKQMALFYAPAVFAYLLGSCIFPRINVVRFLSIAVVTIISFALLFAPLILGAWFDAYRGIALPEIETPPLLAALPFPIDEKAWYYAPMFQLAQSIHRIFPFARGIFEDKVANIWCAIHTFHKLHRYSSTMVQRAALVATSAAIFPPCFILFLKPRKELLPWGLAATSWGFFLCSYQVHEKNVLLPLLPMIVFLAGETGLSPSIRAWVGLANMLGVWTMFPLLKRDELRVPYFVLSLLWAWLIGLPPISLSAYSSQVPNPVNVFTTLIHLGVYGAMIAWHFAESYVAPPENKPDLWVVANVLVGAAGFSICYLWCLWNLLVKSGIAPKSWGGSKAKEQ
ncbi:ALG6, ALG8 glycosyltransferase [Rhizodiscina lignyota]|uniref:Alpha-1,3-glucosyltransferase n=1 Tax=Rhizodiscina lignyota TaxID=1504668 RepID=A0A9P4M6P3_9PEZI|nr:ALG6, ALG8 glycosyltransferase [Rhizodiscina lignyota]